MVNLIMDLNIFKTIWYHICKIDGNIQQTNCDLLTKNPNYVSLR